MSEQPVFMSVGEFAKAIGVSSVTVHRWIKAKKLAAARRGNVVLIPRTEVDRLLAEAEASVEGAA